MFVNNLTAEFFTKCRMKVLHVQFVEFLRHLQLVLEMRITTDFMVVQRNITEIDKITKEPNNLHRQDEMKVLHRNQEDDMKQIMRNITTIGDQGRGKN